MSRSASTYPAVRSDRRSRLLMIAVPLLVVACAVLLHARSDTQAPREVAQSPVERDALHEPARNAERAFVARTENETRSEVSPAAQPSRRQRVRGASRSIKAQRGIEPSTSTTTERDG